MATTTTNFGWDIPQSTDLVKDGATAIAALGQDIDTALVDLKGGTTGQLLSKASNTDLDYTWVSPNPGDITAVTAGTGITGGGTSGDVTVSFDQANFGGGQYAAGKNKIINGDFSIWQRGTSLAGAGYLADRFQGVVTTTTITQTQQAFTAGTAPVAGYEGNYFYRAVTVTGGTAGSRALVQQPIEDVRTFAGQTVTISFWAKAASGTPAIGVELAQVFGSGGSSAVTAIGATAKTISTSWARYSVTASVPSIAGKTIGTGSSLNLVLWIDAGSDFAARAASIGNQSGTFDIWGVQLEAGSTATPFSRNASSIQGELAACQRYLPAIAASNGELFTGQCYSSTAALIPVIFPVTARVAPTGITVNSAGNFRLRSSTATKLTTTAINFSTGTVQGCTIEGVVSTGLTAGNATNLFNESAGTILFTGCEL